ncbi:MAG TPA: hypothetical protein DCM05_09695 [Elusimicrobia bacterium]|nr:hypothetical protein [Elusimicrobiota bacterium]
MRKELELKTQSRAQLIDITREVEGWLRESKARSGLVTVFVPHTTAAVTINENADPSVVRDILNCTTALIPPSEDFTHAEGNSDAHIKSSLFSPSLTCIVEDGRLLLGTWQGIYFAEFDGPRRRNIWLKFIAG